MPHIQGEGVGREKVDKVDRVSKNPRRYWDVGPSEGWTEGGQRWTKGPFKVDKSGQDGPESQSRAMSRPASDCLRLRSYRLTKSGRVRRIVELEERPYGDCRREGSA